MTTGSGMEMEATLEAHFQYRQLELLVEKAGLKDLKELCLLLGKHALVVQPAALRWAGREAARALSLGMRNDADPGEALLKQLQENSQPPHE